MPMTAASAPRIVVKYGTPRCSASRRIDSESALADTLPTVFTTRLISPFLM